MRYEVLVKFAVEQDLCFEECNFGLFLQAQQAALFLCILKEEDCSCKVGAEVQSGLDAQQGHYNLELPEFLGPAVPQHFLDLDDHLVVHALPEQHFDGDDPDLEQLLLYEAVPLAELGVLLGLPMPAPEAAPLEAHPAQSCPDLY